MNQEKRIGGGEWGETKPSEMRRKQERRKRIRDQNRERK